MSTREFLERISEVVKGMKTPESYNPAKISHETPQSTLPTVKLTDNTSVPLVQTPRYESPYKQSIRSIPQYTLPTIENKTSQSLQQMRFVLPPKLVNTMP